MPDRHPTPFSAWLSAQLALKGITSGADLHRRILATDAPPKLGAPAVRAWLRGENRPSVEHMDALLRALDAAPESRAEAWRLLPLSSRAV